MISADYVIVGAGSAGCALAWRLSEEGRRRVLVLEAGGSDRGVLIRMPGALSFPLNMRRYDWGYVTEPEAHLGNRRLACPRGRVIGGSSSINGMVYVRGHPLDYEYWAAAGAKGWGYADVLPYFLRMECWGGASATDGGRPDRSWRGSDGPLHVTRGGQGNILTQAFIEAGRQAGFPLTADCNGAQQEGFGPLEQTVLEGQRWSAAAAYLEPALKRPNVELIRCFVRKVVIDAGRATGVEIQRARRIETVTASKEVILAASAINSPKLLLLSGIGPAPALKALGIEVKLQRPGVGANLQDHLELYVQQACVRPVSLYRYWNPLGKAWAGARWLVARQGPGSSNQFEAGAFVRSSPAEPYPDIQFHFLPLAVRYDGRAAFRGHGYQVHVGPMRSASRGTVTLRDADPRRAPRIAFNYMSQPRDWEDFRHCVRLTRTVFAQPAFDRYRGVEIAPGAEKQTDAELDAHIRDHAESAYHPCGTCRMGSVDDPMAVVDPHCRVIGMEGLRVADSSVFPRITNGNLNAPSIMVGEKAADHILGRRPLAPAEREWIDPAIRVGHLRQ